MKRTYSTAYLTFDSEDVFKQFHSACNGHIFVDEKGSTYKMQVEQAVWTKVPKRQKLPETCGTFENTEDFKEFAERAGKEVEAAVRVDQLEEDKGEKHVAPLVLELNEFASKKRGNRNRRNPKALKEDVKYVIKKRPQQETETRHEEVPEQKPKGYHKGKGPAVIYRKKQPKEDSK